MSRLTRLLLLAPALLLLGGLFAGGLLFGVAQSLGLFSVLDTGEPTMAHYGGLIRDSSVAGGLALTLYISATATALATILGLGLALVLRATARWGTVGRVLAQLPLPVPHLAAALGLGLLLTQSGLLGRLLYSVGLAQAPADVPPLVYDRLGVGIILTYTWKEAPFVALVALAALRAAGGGLERAARTLGATPWQTLRLVTLPLVAPALLRAGLIVFIFTLGAFEVPLLLGQSYPRMLAVEAFLRYNDSDLALRPTALALATLIAGAALLALPPYLWLLHQAERRDACDG